MNYEDLSARGGSASGEKQRPPWMEYCLLPSSVYNGNSVELLRDGEEAFPEMLAAIDKARHFILFEVYSFGEDQVGRRFQEALERKARKGVRVFVIYDAIGSLLTSRSFFDRMSFAGVQIAEYHPLAPWKPYWNWFRRNHRKILLVDGNISFIGGLNASEDDGPRSWGGRGWRDTQVKLEGPIIKELASVFWESWQRCRGDIAEIRPEDVIHRSASGGTPPGAAANGVPVSLVSSSGLRNRHSIRRSYKYAINKAKNFIYITNAYFLPGRSIYRRLIRAAKKGVRVVILTPSQTDHPLVRWASWALYRHLLNSGIEIYEWQPSVLHSKTAVIDGVWSSVGSHNLDHRSLHYNLEINVNILGTEFGGKMKQMFEKDLESSRRITLENCRSQRFLFKAASRILYWFRYWL